MKRIINHPSQLASVLQSTRKHQKITQAQLALVLNASQPAVSRLELNPNNIRLGDLLRVCHLLGLELSINEKQQGIEQTPSGIGHPKKIKRA
jgi:HTH-type transcriptional regulator / antitoxin HipB|uniref:helix-turn-helix domain-containing protein n=1 Tax=Orrella sp. TaxID=1921583 RepID=UPI00404831B0